MDLCALILVGGSRAGSRSLAAVAAIRRALMEVHAESGLEDVFALNCNWVGSERRLAQS